MRLLVRFVFFALALLFGLAAWYAMASAQTPSRQSTNTNTNVNGSPGPDAFYNLNGNVNASTGVPMNGNMSWNSNGTYTADAAGAGADGSPEDVPAAVSLGEPKTFWGYATTQTVTLRSAPDSGATVVDTIQLTEYEGAEILETSGGHLRVRFGANADAEGGTRERDVEGWVEWGAVVPHASAIVIDVDSGEVAARVPLQSGLASVAFSPDGKHAVFYGTVAQGPHGEGSNTAVEVDAETFKTLRTIETTAASGFAAFQHDGEEIYALTQQINYGERGSDSKLQPFRIRGGQVEDVSGGALPRKIKGEVAVSPDGRTALIFHDSEGGAKSRRVDVVDPKTLGVSNSFEVPAGEGGEGWPGEYALSRDGSELYLRGANVGERIAVFDTQTGKRVREIPVRVPADHWTSLWQGGVAGDALLMRFWRSEGEDEAVSQSFWIKPDGQRVAAGRGVDNVIEVGGVLYAVNDEATVFFKLDGDKRVREEFKIARPEAREDGAEGGGQTVFGLAATPDGKRIIIFLGVEHGC